MGEVVEFGRNRWVIGIPRLGGVVVAPHRHQQARAQQFPDTSADG